MSNNDKGLSNKNKEERVQVYIGWILDDMTREGPTKSVTFEQRPERGEGQYHAYISSLANY